MRTQSPKTPGLDNQMAQEYACLQALQRFFPNCSTHNPMLVARLKLRFQEVRKDNQDMFTALAKGFLIKYLMRDLPKSVILDEMDITVQSALDGSHELRCSSQDFRMVLRCTYNGGRRAYFYCNYRVRGREAVRHKILLSAPKPKASAASREIPQDHLEMAVTAIPENTTSPELKLGA